MDTAELLEQMDMTIEQFECLREWAQVVAARLNQWMNDFVAKFQETCAAIAEALKGFFDAVELTKGGFHPEWRSRHHSLEPRFARHPDAKLGKQYQFTHLAGRR